MIFYHIYFTIRKCKRWGKHWSSFIQQQENTDPTKWGPKLVYTISSFSIIVLLLQYSSRYTPWMQLQNLKDSLSINNSLLFITYFWPPGVYFNWPFLWMESNCRRWIPSSKTDYRYKEFWCFSSVSWNNGLKKKTKANLRDFDSCDRPSNLTQIGFFGMRDLEIWWMTSKNNDSICSESCQNDNFQCLQWRKFYQNDKISIFYVISNCASP